VLPGLAMPAYSEEATPQVAETSGVQGPALTKERLREWVKRWCDGEREGLPPISTWNTSQVTDTSSLFSGKSDFNDDISAWDTSSVTTMDHMFWNASSFNQPLGGWRVDKVTNMQSMFHSASSFNQALNGWRVDNVTDMCAMFYAASAFNQPLNDWRVDNVTTMSHMFYDAKSLNQPLNDWRVDNVKDMLCMFQGARSFNQPLSSWRVNDVANDHAIRRYRFRTRNAPTSFSAAFSRAISVMSRREAAQGEARRRPPAPARSPDLASRQRQRQEQRMRAVHTIQRDWRARGVVDRTARQRPEEIRRRQCGPVELDAVLQIQDAWRDRKRWLAGADARAARTAARLLRIASRDARVAN